MWTMRCLALVAVIAATSNAMSEGQPAGGDKGDFRGETVLYGKGEVINFVFNVKTGGGWFVSEKAKKPIAEEKAPGDGSYDFRTGVSADDYWLFRLDRDTGKTWALREGKWVDVKDSSALKRGNYEMFVKTDVRGVWVRRLSRTTGELWYCRWDSKDKTWSWSPLPK